jgi:hypothetical protein
MPALLVTLLLVSAAGFAFTYAGVTLVRHVVRRGVGDGHNDVLAAIFGVGGTIYAVFLAFLVITIWADHDIAKNNVAEEASLLGTLYRASTGMEPASGARMRGLVRQYTHAVIDEEWAVQAQSGGTSEKAREAALNMFRLFGEIPPPIRQSDMSIEQTMLGLVAQMQADRNKRILQSEERISPLIWAVAIANGLLVIVMSFFLYPDRDWPHVVMSAMLAAMIGMLICTTWIFEQPFRGLLALRAHAFEHSLEVYDSVDRALLQDKAKPAPIR